VLKRGKGVWRGEGEWVRKKNKKGGTEEGKRESKNPF
jgi:hypothetical protein